MWLSVYFRISFDIKHGAFPNNSVELKRSVESAFSIPKARRISISENTVSYTTLNLSISVISRVRFLFFHSKVD